MSDGGRALADYVAALAEHTDALNRLSAVLARNTAPVMWLAAVEQWRAEPWWRRGREPRLRT